MKHELIEALEGLLTPLVQGEPNEHNAVIYRTIEGIREEDANMVNTSLWADNPTIDTPSKWLMNFYSWIDIYPADSSKVGHLYNTLADKETTDREARPVAYKAATPIVVPQGSVPIPMLTIAERLNNEKAIIKDIWDRATAAGFTVVQVFDGMETFVPEDFEAAWDIIISVDESSLTFGKPNDHMRWSVYMILGNGNNGFDVATDCSVGDGEWQDLMNAHNEWLEERENAFNTTG